jgi:hypothetical protein
MKNKKLLLTTAAVLALNASAMAQENTFADRFAPVEPAPKAEPLPPSSFTELINNLKSVPPAPKPEPQKPEPPKPKVVVWTNGYGPARSNFDTWGDFAYECKDMKTQQRISYVVRPAEGKIYWTDKSAIVNATVIPAHTYYDEFHQPIALDRVQQLHWDNYMLADLGDQIIFAERNGPVTAICRHIEVPQ